MVEWSEKHRPVPINVGYPVSAITSCSSGSVFLAGRLGYIGFIKDRDILNEAIDGPASQGFITDIHCIHNYVYAVGMGRQVYRRLNSGQWETFEAGMDKSVEDELDITGLNAIDGFSDEELYAIGFDGEIWLFQNKAWRQIDSPTNNTLECICIAEKHVYVAGRSGTLLRGRNDIWQTLEYPELKEDIWDIEWYLGRIYLTTSNKLFAISTDSKLEEVDQHLLEPRKYLKLHAANGALWSFGPDRLSWTEDGTSWHDAIWSKR